MRKPSKSKKSIKDSVADRPSTNIRIERLLSDRSKDEQIRILDALEIVKDRGPSGITVSEWADLVRQLHPEEDYSLKDLLRSVVKDFGCCVKRIGDKQYGWDESDRDIAQVSPQMQQAVHGQIEMTSAAMALIREMKRFTKNELASRLASATGMPNQYAVMFADHVLSQFVGGTLKRVGPDTYEVIDEKKPTNQDSVDALKNIAKNAGKA